MNYSLKAAAVILLGVSFSSCQEFLTEEPRSVITTDQFYTEPQQAENVVNNMYRKGAPSPWIFGGVYSGMQGMYGPYVSGFFDNEYKGQELHIEFGQQLTLNGTNVNGYINGIWSTMYDAISDANNAVKYVPQTPGVDDTRSRQLVGEARFFRGWAYFTLVRLFGEVPIVTRPYESLDSLFLPKSPTSEVYAQIVADLTYAIDEGGLSESTMANNGYRVTKGAAQAVLADVYLTMGGFPLQDDQSANAAAVAEALINTGAHSLAQNNADELADGDFTNSAYNQIRREETRATEDIYPIEFLIGISNSEYPRFCWPVTTTSLTKYDITNGAYQPRAEFLNGYDRENDLRIQEKQYWHSTAVVGDSTITFPTAPYIWNDDQAIFESAASQKGVHAYGYAEVLLIAAESIARSEGVNDRAVDYLTQVRSRAYWKQDVEEIKSELAGLSVDDFVQEVWKERYRELVFDFKIWYDMIRTRQYPLTTEDGGGDIEYVPLVGQENTWGKAFQEKNLLWPLPDQELQRNPELPQNPGY